MLSKRRRRLTPVEEYLAWLAGRMPSQALADDAARRPRLMLEEWLDAHRRELAAQRKATRGYYLNSKGP